MFGMSIGKNSSKYVILTVTAFVVTGIMIIRNGGIIG